MSSNQKKSSDTVILEANGTSYECVGRTGKGSFGVVYKAVEVGTNRVVAIKRVLQDPKYKNRELQIMKMVAHRNTVQLVDSFYERYKGEVYLNLVLGYIPKNLYEVCSSYTKKNDRMPFSLIQVYTYQLCRSLAYVHSLGICHRDIKPQNLLIHPETNELRLCDFGSAKILIKGEPNVSYICSRYYRAPELIFGACDYTKAIDVWSAGCVMAELILGSPLFAGESGIDQLVEIIKVLGTPTKEEIRAMNPDYKDYKQFPSIKPHPWQKLFPSDTPTSALDLISKMLVYTPSSRVKPLEACTHDFFDDLRLHSQPNGIKLPLLFDFSPDELASAHKQALLEKLLPPEDLVKLATQYDITLPTRQATPPSADITAPPSNPDAPPPTLSPSDPPPPSSVDPDSTANPPAVPVHPEQPVPIVTDPPSVPEVPKVQEVSQIPENPSQVQEKPVIPDSGVEVVVVSEPPKPVILDSDSSNVETSVPPVPENPFVQDFPCSHVDPPPPGPPPQEPSGEPLVQSEPPPDDKN